jgi:dienelactone hydrolase
MGRRTAVTAWAGLLALSLVAQAPGSSLQSPDFAAQPPASSFQPPALTVFAPGERPDDRRLGAIRDLDTHCPFTPPATVAAWRERAAALRRQIQVALGLWPWPTRTPLNARVHGTVERDDYVVDKVVFESLPGHYVTGSLYRPKGRPGRLPAVLSPHGHWPGGRFHDAGEKDAREAIASGAEPFEAAARHPLQARAVHLARMGAVTFLYDMEGYADSVQIPRAVAHELKAARPQMHDPRAWGLYSPQAELHLQSVMGLQTWNAIRALDYLTSRDDVDPLRVGVTGASGGATQTMMVAALDERPAAFFPAVMVSTHMQGGCTCENASYLRIGTGNAEIASLAAPKPLGMTAANDWTKEFATDGYPDVQRVFALSGAPDHVLLRPFVQFEHNYNGVARAVMYEWFNRHLRLGFDEPPKERPFVPLTVAEASVWDDGHPKPAGEAHERALLEWLTRDAAAAIAALDPTDAARAGRFTEVVGGAFAVILGGPVAQNDEVRFEERGTEPDGGTTLTRGLLRRESNGAALPALLWSRHRAKGVAILVSPDGKDSLVPSRVASARGTRSNDPWLPASAGRLLAAGYDVLEIDVLGHGELRAPDVPFDRMRLASERAHAGFTYGYNLPLPAQRVQDVLTAIRFARSRAGRNGRVLLVGTGPAAAWAAGARALADGAVDRAALDLEGFRFGATDRIDSPDFLPGALKYGDVPALLALSAPGPVWVRDRGGPPGDLDIVRRAYGFESARLTVAGADSRLEDGVSWAVGMKNEE